MITWTHKSRWMNRKELVFNSRVEQHVQPTIETWEEQALQVLQHYDLNTKHFWSWKVKYFFNLKKRSPLIVERFCIFFRWHQICHKFLWKGLAHRTLSEWGIAISAAIYFKIMSTLHSAILFICKKMKHFIRECLKFSSPPSPQHQWPPQPRVLVLSQVRLDSCCCSPSLV